MNFHSNDNRSAEPVNSGMTGGPPVSRWPCAQTVTAMRGRSWETFSTMMESSGPSRRRPHRIGSVVSSRRNRFEVKRHELLDHLRPPHDLLESWKWRLGSGAASTVKSITACAQDLCTTRDCPDSLGRDRTLRTIPRSQLPPLTKPSPAKPPRNHLLLNPYFI